MRTHPLLALFTTTITLTSTGLVAGSLAGTGPATPLVGRTTAHGPAPDPDARGLPYGQPPAAESTRAAGVEHDPVLAASPALLPRRLLLRTPALGEPGLALASVAPRHRLVLRSPSPRSLRRAVALSSLVVRRHLASAAEPASGVWLALRTCESGGNYRADTGNGYFGAYQFLPTTWWALGYHGLPNQAPVGVQDQAARVLEARAGWSPWPQCSAILGLR